MKLSVLGQIYDQIAQAGSDSRRVRILTDLFRHLDGQTLEAAAHLTMGELIKPQMTDRLGIGPGEIEDEVKKTGDLSEVAIRLVNNVNAPTVTELWRRANRVVERDEHRQKFIEHIFTHTTANGARYFCPPGAEPDAHRHRVRGAHPSDCRGIRCRGRSLRTSPRHEQ